MGAEEAGLFGMKGDAGELEYARELLNEYRQMEAAAEAADKAKAKLAGQMDAGQQLKEQLQTPIEAFRSEVKRLAELRDVGAIDQDTFGRGTKAAERRALDMAGVRDVKTRAPSTTFQSFAGFGQAIQRALGSGADKVQREQLEVQKAGATLQTAMNETLTKIEGKLPPVAVCGR